MMNLTLGVTLNIFSTTTLFLTKFSLANWSNLFYKVIVLWNESKAFWQKPGLKSLVV
jgi:hypothetical protein